MKLPNGYGSVYKLPGSRRKPWAVRITVSRTTDLNGKTSWKYRYLGYYTTQSEALIALANYNSNPYDLDAEKITFSEVFEKWSSEHYPKISHSSIKGYTAAYKVCTPLYNMKFSDIRKSHLQKAIDICGKNYPTLKRMCVLFSVLFKFALENDITNKDYSKYVDVKQYKDRNPNKHTRTPFTHDEINILWERKDTNEYISVVLMLIYSGVRVSELLNLKKTDVNLSERWFNVIASKTESGIRQVPIADKIFPFFDYWYNKNDCEYLVSTPNGKCFGYANYYNCYWLPLVESLGIEHTPHCTRHTCVSLLTAAGVDDKIIKRIVGHKGESVTETVYTHFEMQQLADAINKI